MRSSAAAPQVYGLVVTDRNGKALRSLTLDKARELAKALVSVAEAIEFVSTPRDLLDRELHLQSKGVSGYSRALRPSRGIESSIPPFNRRSPN